MEEKNTNKYISGTNVKKKTVIIASVVLAVLLAITAFAIAIFSAKPYDVKDGQVDVYKVTSKIYSEAIVAVMPKTITGTDNGKKVDFYIEVNDDYDRKTDDPIEQFQVYYFDNNDKKQICANGIYRGNVETMYPLVGFFIAGMNSLKVLRNVIVAVFVVLILASLGLAGYLIYLLVSVKKDKAYSSKILGE